MLLSGASLLRRLVLVQLSVSLLRKDVQLGDFEITFPAFECCLGCVFVAFCVTDSLESFRCALVIGTVLVVFVLATH